MVATLKLQVSVTFSGRLNMNVFCNSRTSTWVFNRRTLKKRLFFNVRSTINSVVFSTFMGVDMRTLALWVNGTMN